MSTLSGVRVLDLTRLLPGDYCTMILGDMGAEVIKVEEPGLGDYIRWVPPLINGQSICHLMLNRNKKSMKLNLKSEKSKEVFFKLVEKSDVVIECFRPGVVKSLGIDYESVSKVNQRIVYCSMSGYGQDGPYRDLPGHDVNYLGYGGVLGITGPSGGAPVIPGIQIADLTTGLMTVMAILAALLARERMGRGQYIDVSFLDVVTSLMVLPAAFYIGEEKSPKRGEWLLNGGFPCYNIYETKDGKYITIGCLEPQFWTNLCNVLGVMSFAGHQYTNDEAKLREMFQTIREIFKTRTLDEWLKLLSKEDVPCGPVYDLDEVFRDPQILHRKMIVEVEYPGVGKIKQLGTPVKFSKTPCEMRSPPPSFGEHTEQILKWLGYSEREILNMRGKGVT
ncbi:MAG: formyl-coenzyme A transferase [Candidatus Bathyarchaeota archaeon BA2]|nr:MAG: formyl-coenzyme A transferase [Candidatus Bathyarchaeota archaeon BA2]